uniref:Uncharacterized protein n=1 Tax=Rhizophora mucronata TaxID=61149 RepID=A0A2P2NR57_RHIMU
MKDAIMPASFLGKAPCSEKHMDWEQHYFVDLATRLNCGYPMNYLAT